MSLSITSHISIKRYNFVISILNLLAFLLFLAIFSSCENLEPSNKAKKKEVNLVMKVLDTLTIFSDTTFNIDNAGNFFVSKEDKKFIVTNTSNDAIYDFNLSDGTIVSKTNIPTEGPNSIAMFSKFDGTIKIREKNKYYYISHFLNTIYFLDDNLITEVNQIKEEQLNFYKYFSATYARPQIVGKYAFINHIANPRFILDKVPCLSLLDTSNNKIVQPFFYPSIYTDHFWSDQPYIYLANIQYIPNIKKYYLAFPIDDNIYVYDKNFNFEYTKSVKSKFISKILPFRNKPLSGDENYDFMKEKEHFNSLSYYCDAYFDNQNHHYYRVVRKSYTDENGNLDRKYYFIICDDSLNVLDEIELDNNSYDIYKSFMTKRGLMLFNKVRYVDEGKLTYDLVKFE